MTVPWMCQLLGARLLGVVVVFLEGDVRIMELALLWPDGSGFGLFSESGILLELVVDARVGAIDRHTCWLRHACVGAGVCSPGGEVEGLEQLSS